MLRTLVEALIAVSAIGVSIYLVNEAVEFAETQKAYKMLAGVDRKGSIHYNEAPPVKTPRILKYSKPFKLGL